MALPSVSSRQAERSQTARAPQSLSLAVTRERRQQAMVAEVRVQVTPQPPFRLPRSSLPDGTARFDRGVLKRLIHVNGAPAVVAVAQPSHDRVLFGAFAQSDDVASRAIERMRFALCVDVEVAPFVKRFRHDPLIGASLARRPWLRPQRRPQPFEALAWAICEQLIEYKRAAAIERRIVAKLGVRIVDPRFGALRDLPAPEALAAVSPALLQSFDLGGARARTLLRVARAIATGEIDFRDADRQKRTQRLAAIAGVGRWTLDMLALHGEGDEDAVPAGDVGLLRLAGRVSSGGNPRAFGDESDVRRLFARYGRWAGLAVTHLLVP